MTDVSLGEHIARAGYSDLARLCDTARALQSCNVKIHRPLRLTLMLDYCA